VNAPSDKPPRGSAARPNEAAQGGLSPAGPHATVIDPDAEVAPVQVLELAAACVRFVATACTVEPDFTSSTLSLVDHYVAQARASVAERPETRGLIAHAVGAYLGEVVRRTHACWWRLDSDDPGAWRLEFRNVLLSFYPVQVAYAALERSDDGATFSGFELPDEDRDALIERLENLPGVSEEQYFAPSTKLEVLDIAVDGLLAKRARTPASARPHVPEDYAPHRGGGG